MIVPIHSGLPLARRISRGDVWLLSQYAASPGDVERIGSGCAVFAGAASPLTHASGLGLAGPVSEAEIERMEEFFFSRGAGAPVEVNPLADASLREALDHRGYRLGEFENVLVRRIGVAGLSPLGAPEIERCPPHGRGAWASLTARGFFGREEVNAEEIAVGSMIFRASLCLVARLSGVPAGGAALAIHDATAYFFADSTLPAFRGRGVQSALISARLREAAGRGCDLAVACTVPGSQSQRNYERAGFQVAYTKAGMYREAPRRRAPSPEAASW